MRAQVNKTRCIAPIKAAVLFVVLLLAAFVVGAWHNQAQAQTYTTGSDTELGTRFDAREQGWIGDTVRLQDPWGSCWAIAATEAMEANLVKQGALKRNMRFSERQLLWAASRPVEASMALTNSGVQLGQLTAQAGEGQHPAEDLEVFFGDNAFMEMGGNYYVVYQTIASGRGPVLYKTAPYQNEEKLVDSSGQYYSMEGTWSLDDDTVFAGTYQLRNVQVLPTPATFTDTADVSTYSLNKEALQDVKRAIKEYGSITIAYDEHYYDEQNNTAFTDESMGNSHGVQIVGWDDSISRNLFTTGTNGKPEGDGAWIVRNSWGAAGQDFPTEGNFGDNGYFYLSYYDRSAQMFAAYDMIAPGSDESTQIINQYDFVGQMSQASSRLVSSGQPLLSANVFTAECTQQLKAVSVDTYNPGTQVTTWLYLLDDDAADPSAGTYDPTQGTLLEEKQVTIEHAGYHRIALDQAHTVQKGQRFAVVQSAVEPASRDDSQGSENSQDGENKEDTFIATLEAGNSEKAVQLRSYRHYDTVVVNAGESLLYASLDGSDPSWMDATEVGEFLTQSGRLATPYGNVCIKVFADPAASSAKPLSDDSNKKTQKNPVEKVTQGKVYAKAAGVRVDSTMGKQVVGPQVRSANLNTGDTVNVRMLQLACGLVALLLAVLLAARVLGAHGRQSL